MPVTTAIGAPRREPEEDQRSASAARWRRLVTPSTVQYTVLGVGFIAIMVAARNHWFHSDDWGFITQRGLIGADYSIWWPHMEHWSTLPILVWRAVESLFGLDSYLPFLALNVALHCGIAHVLWRIMRRTGVAPWIATGFSAVFLFYGTGYENIGWAFQITFNGGLLLGLCALLAAEHTGQDNRLWTLAGITCLTAGTMTAGAILPFIPVAAAVAWIRGGWRRGLAVGAVPAAVYGLWLALIGYNGLGVASQISGKSGTQVLIEGMRGAPAFVWTSLTNALDGLWGVSGLGALLIAGIVCYAAVRFGPRSWRSRELLALATAATAVLQMAMAGVGRVAAFGPEAAATSRHAYIAMALLTPITALFASYATEKVRGGGVVTWALLATAICWGGLTLAVHMHDQGGPQQGVRSEFLAIARVLADGIEPAPHATVMLGPSPVAATAVARLVSAGEATIPPEVPASAYLDVRAMVQVGLAESPGPYEGVGGDSSCHELTAGGAAESFPVEHPGALSIQASAPSTVEVALQTDDGRTSDWRPLQIPAGEDTHVTTTATGTTLLLRLTDTDSPPGPVTACN